MGLQKDGDLWEQAWNAVLERGASNQNLRKVKGHATIQYIEAGLRAAADKEGNDKSDANADDGVDMVKRGRAGRPWQAGCRKTCGLQKLMQRIQKMIAVVAIVKSNPWL